MSDDNLDIEVTVGEVKVDREARNRRWLKYWANVRKYAPDSAVVQAARDNGDLEDHDARNASLEEESKKGKD